MVVTNDILLLLFFLKAILGLHWYEWERKEQETGGGRKKRNDEVKWLEDYLSKKINKIRGKHKNVVKKRYMTVVKLII